MDAVKMACMLLWYIFAALLDAPLFFGSPITSVGRRTALLFTPRRVLGALAGTLCRRLLCPVRSVILSPVWWGWTVRAWRCCLNLCLSVVDRT